MNERNCVVSKVSLDHVGHVLDVDATCRGVRAHHHAELLLLHRGECLLGFGRGPGFMVHDMPAIMDCNIVSTINMQARLRSKQHASR